MQKQFFLLFALLLLASCSNTKQTAKAPLNNPSSLNMSNKQSDPDSATTITEKHWKLITLKKQPATMSKHQEREMFFLLKNDTTVVRGFSGCNYFEGHYTLTDFNLTFKEIISTKKACLDLIIPENEVFQLFNEVRSFTLIGDTLLLKNLEGNILAKFEAIYF